MISSDNNVQEQMNNGTVQSRKLRNHQDGESFPFSNQRTIKDCHNQGAEDCESTQFESCSVVSSMEASAASESAMDNESLSTSTDHLISSSETLDHEQSLSTAHEADQAGLNHQQDSFATQEVGVPLPSYIAMPNPFIPTMSLQPHLVQFQLVHPLEQYQGYAPQDEMTASNPISPGVPFVRNYVPFYWVPAISSDLQTRMFPTAVSTSPLVNYFNSPGCVYPNFNAHSGVLPTAPHKPMPGFTAGNEVGELWSGNCDYSEWIEKGGSNLFISWSGTGSELRAKLCHHNLDVRTVRKTSDVEVFNVIFESYMNARKAFLMQREIKLRMIPPKNSRRNWLRNPSRKFWVKFETKYRLVVKKGKAECHDVVGDLLMTDYNEGKGCIIWADQLKGHRIRIVGCEGNFKFPSGRIVKMKGVPAYSDAKPLGWISYRSRRAGELFVIRRSGNNIGDYIYRE